MQKSNYSEKIICTRNVKKNIKIFRYIFIIHLWSTDIAINVHYKI